MTPPEESERVSPRSRMEADPLIATHHFPGRDADDYYHQVLYSQHAAGRTEGAAGSAEASISKRRPIEQNNPNGCCSENETSAAICFSSSARF